MKNYIYFFMSFAITYKSNRLYVNIYLFLWQCIYFIVMNSPDFRNAGRSAM